MHVLCHACRAWLPSRRPCSLPCPGPCSSTFLPLCPCRCLPACLPCLPTCVARPCQAYILFRAQLAPPFTFSPGHETTEVQLFAPDSIPWDSLAFSSVTITLRNVVEDMASGTWHVHHGGWSVAGAGRRCSAHHGTLGLFGQPAGACRSGPEGEAAADEPHEPRTCPPHPPPLSCCRRHPPRAGRSAQRARRVPAGGPPQDALQRVSSLASGLTKGESVWLLCLGGAPLSCHHIINGNGLPPPLLSTAPRLSCAAG